MALRYGETVASGVTANKVSTAVAVWVDAEAGFYTPEVATGNQVANFVQVRWAAYDKIGCGLYDCVDDDTAQWRIVCRYKSSAGGDAADFSDTVAVENNIKTEVCEAPTRSRRQAERDGAAAAAFVTNGHARLKVAELTAGQIDPISFEIETAADKLATLAAEAEIPLTYIAAPPPAPEAPPPSPALQGADGSAVTDDGGALAWGVSLVVLLFFAIVIFVPLCCYRHTGGNIGDQVRLSTTHSNPGFVLRYLPPDQRELLRMKIADDRDAVGKQIATYSNPIIGWLHMPMDKKNPRPLEVDSELLSKEVARTESGALKGPSGVSAAPKSMPRTGGKEEGTPRLLSGTGSTPAPRPAELPTGGDDAFGGDAGGEDMVDESDEDRQRRIEWIKYYVRTGEPDKAYELGWDGLPFQIAVGAPTDLTRI